MGELRNLHRDVNGVSSSGLDRLVPLGFLVVGSLGHAVGGHDGVEGLGVSIHQSHELVLKGESPLRMHAEFFPTAVPAALVGAEVGHHRRKGRTQGASIS